MNLLNFNIFTGQPSDIFQLNAGKHIINTINPHSYVISLKDKAFHDALLNSDTLLPDGSGIVLASLVLNHTAIKKLSGPFIFEKGLDFFNKRKSKVYFLGSTDKVLLKIEDKIRHNYKNISVKTYSPPFSDNFTDTDNNKIIKDIENFSPDMICVGMTAPKQEKWVFDNKEKLPDCYIMSIGAAFDWFSGVKKPPSKLSEKLHLIWLERFFYEPKRMMPRMVSMIHFLFLLLTCKIKQMKFW